ncbi:MAG: 2-succinyl-5-enolpyruvyl-6-hydroxy-3-cyclohexene-1-carboxylic-acid synthase, partial [Thermocrispum sp.]
MNPSTAQARVIVDELIRNTVSHVVLCPGSRNGPLSLALYDAAEAGRVDLHVRVDERSASFLALGIAARIGRPAAVACTSGTAAANFHPAVLEADRAGVPLIVLTADRPPELRAAGANQVIDQYRLYGDAVRYFAEFAVAHEHPGQNAYWRSQICRAWNAAYGAGATRTDSDDTGHRATFSPPANEAWIRRSGPVHLNVPFREPLIPDGDTGLSEWCEPLEGRPHGQRWTKLPDYGHGAGPPDGFAGAVVVPSTRTGLVLACDSGVPAVSEWAAEHGWPVIAETGAAGLSGASAVTSGAWLLGVPEFVAAHRPEQVLCIGRPTVFRQVHALLADTRVEVLLVRPDADWPAPAHNVRQVGQWFAEPTKPADPQWLSRWQRADELARDAVARALAAEPWPNGPGVAAELLAAVPAGSLLVVGSSNPARDIALAAG